MWCICQTTRPKWSFSWTSWMELKLLWVTKIKHIFLFYFIFLSDIKTLSAALSSRHPRPCLVCALAPWWPPSSSSSSNSGKGLNSRTWQRLSRFLQSSWKHLTYPHSFVSNKPPYLRHQCGRNSSWHPVPPLPHPGVRPASWPADDGKDQSQNLLCTHFCAADSGTQR